VRSEGLAALVATHNYELAAKMDRALVLHEGRIIDGGKLAKKA
jgi:lipoprotein-releasing system ATP-binding protein